MNKRDNEKAAKKTENLFTTERGANHCHLSDKVLSGTNPWYSSICRQRYQRKVASHFLAPRSKFSCNLQYKQQQWKKLGLPLVEWFLLKPYNFSKLNFNLFADLQIGTPAHSFPLGCANLWLHGNLNTIKSWFLSECYTFSETSLVFRPIVMIPDELIPFHVASASTNFTFPCPFLVRPSKEWQFNENILSISN